MDEVLVLSIKRTVVLQAEKFVELEMRIQYLQIRGWRIERFPQFISGGWQVSLSHIDTGPFELENDQLCTMFA